MINSGSSSQFFSPSILLGCLSVVLVAIIIVIVPLWSIVIFIMNHHWKRIYHRLQMNKAHIVLFSFVVDFFGNLGFFFLINKLLSLSLSLSLLLPILAINVEKNTIMTANFDSATTLVYRVLVVKNCSCFVVIVLPYFL